MTRVLTVLILLAGLSCGGFWYWTTTPQYSIEQVRDAVKTHDKQKFDKHVDVNEFASGLVDDTVAEPMREVMGGGTIGRWIVAGVSGFIKPSIVSGVKEELYTLVNTGGFNKSEGGTVSSLNDRLCLSKNDFKRVDQIKADGKLAKATIVLHNSAHNKDLNLDVQMRDMGGYWQVTRMLNFPEFAGQLAALENSSDGVHENAENKDVVRIEIGGDADEKNEQQSDDQSNVQINVQTNMETTVNVKEN